MSEQKDYSQLNLEELRAEAKKFQNNERLAAGLIGFLIGVLVYGVVTKGVNFLPTALPIILIVLIARNAKAHKENRKRVHKAIGAKTEENKA